MTTTISHLRKESHVAIGDIIERSTDELISRWADRAKQEQPTAQRVHHDVLVDHLPAFLAKLGRSLATAGDDSLGPKREAEEHGDQRWDNGWSVIELVRDYQILRVVLVEFLEEVLGRRLESRESLVLNVGIDDAIASSVAAFAASQTTPGTSATTTRNEALDLLFNVLGVVGHELRNPLAPLANSLEILRMGCADPAQIENARQMMARQLLVLNRLVDDLMDLPRLARGKMSLDLKQIDVVRLVRACADDRRKGLEAAGLALVVDVPDGPVWAVGDEARLTQVFSNLLGNSLKFTDRGGTVTVQLTAIGNRAQVTVQDTGLGIEASMLPRVFEAYAQADGSLARSRGGLGLGLALVKGVVELHGGSVVAASDGPGTGTAVTVELPIAKSASEPTAGSHAAASPVKPRRLLIIEDNPDSAESLKLYLELHGHTVMVARTGADGVKLAAATSPEVVICDVGLPDMDGYAVAAELRRLVSPVPSLIVALSGHGPTKGSNDEPDKVFDYYLLKPADPDRVSRLIAANSPPTDHGL
jgi:signal transduction histidine kinase/ActR/RegA family two-component response regulator